MKVKTKPTNIMFYSQTDIIMDYIVLWQFNNQSILLHLYHFPRQNYLIYKWGIRVTYLLKGFV